MRVLLQCAEPDNLSNLFWIFLHKLSKRFLRFMLLVWEDLILSSENKICNAHNILVFVR